MKRPDIALAGAICALLAAQPVLAASVAVTYDDLDLTTVEGRKELDHRVDKAAKEVCGFHDVTVGSRVVPREVRACIKQARKQIEKNLAAIIENENAGG